jgi:hypothetical protein
MRRRVFIDLIGDTYFVLYAERGFRCRRSAAQFHAADTTIDRVAAWVNSNNRLSLIPKPERVNDL